jgi:hypothetical protein
MENALAKALNEMADLYEYGHLEAATNPALFIRAIAEDIRQMREALGIDGMTELPEPRDGI